MDLLRAMQTFVATVQAGSMSAAAAELGLSPAMVGQHVAALEERLSTRLLNRTTRRQSLTDFGASYFEQCRDILDRVALAEEAAEVQRTRARGRLRVAAPMTFGSEVLMPALGAYRAQAPDVTLDITLTDRNVDLVEEGFDVGFHIGDLADSRVIARPLAPYRIMICAAPDYVARRGMPAHPADLAGHEAIGLTSSARLPWSFSRDDEQVDVMPARMITVNNGQAVRAACRAGLGVVVQPEFLLRQDIEAGVLVQLLPEWDLGKRSMWLLYYRDRRMTPRILSFITFSLATFCPRVEADGSAEVPVFAR